MVSKLQLILLVLVISLSIIGCDKETQITEDVDVITTSNIVKSNLFKVKTIITDDKQYNAANSDPFTFVSLTIEDEIIMMTGSYDGGCGAAEFSFITHSKVDYSGNIPEIKGVFVLKDADPCLKTMSKQVAFDAAPLQIQGHNTLEISIQGYGSVLYHY